MDNVPLIKNNKKFLKIQSIIIFNYLKNCQNNGDKRSDNDIVSEWIRNNSIRFRKLWIATGGNLG